MKSVRTNIYHLDFDRDLALPRRQKSRGEYDVASTSGCEKVLSCINLGVTTCIIGEGRMGGEIGDGFERVIAIWNKYNCRRFSVLAVTRRCNPYFLLDYRNKPPLRHNSLTYHSFPFGCLLSTIRTYSIHDNASTIILPQRHNYYSLGRNSTSF